MTETHNPDTPAAPAATVAALAAAGERHAVPVPGGGQVVWRRYGRGPALVLLHGGHGSWLHWARNIEALAAQHSVWVVDLPGCGESDLPPEPTLDALLAATQASLDALLGAGTPLTLIGFSFGGLVAACLAARRGDVPRLALLGPGGHGGPRRPRGELRAWREAWRQGDQAALDVAMRHNLWAHMLHADAAIDALALHIHTEACIRTRLHSKPHSRSGVMRPALQAWQGALLLAWGEHDVTAHPAALAAELAQGHADCRSHIVPEAGHWLPYEQPEATHRLLLDWLAHTA